MIYEDDLIKDTVIVRTGRSAEELMEMQYVYDVKPVRTDGTVWI